MEPELHDLNEYSSTNFTKVFAVHLQYFLPLVAWHTSVFDNAWLEQSTFAPAQSNGQHYSDC